MTNELIARKSATGNGATPAPRTQRVLRWMRASVRASRVAAQAELGGQHAVEVERFDRAVAQVDDAVFAAGPRAARVRMADVLPTPGAGEDADAGLAGEHVPALTAV